MDYHGKKFIKSRIPALDALSAYVPNGHENDEALLRASSEIGYARWYPVEGGNKVLFLYEGGTYDDKFFSLEKGAWSHEHCKECSCKIEAMDLCWVTESGPVVILCMNCYERMLNKK